MDDLCVDCRAGAAFYGVSDLAIALLALSLMDAFKVPAAGSITASLLILIGLLAMGAPLPTRLRESTPITGVIQK